MDMTRNSATPFGQFDLDEARLTLRAQADGMTHVLVWQRAKSKAAPFVLAGSRRKRSCELPATPTTR
jgi:hypothetical protein